MIRYFTFLLLIQLALRSAVAGQSSTLPLLDTKNTNSLPDAPSARTKSSSVVSDTATKSNQNTDESAANSVDSLSTVHLTLLSEISSKIPSGSRFLARVASPSPHQAGVLPPGSIVEGHVQTIRARRMLRGGSFRLIFDRIKLPNGTVIPANLYLIGSDSKSVKFDGEGAVHPTLGKKRLVLQLGGTAAIAKLADDIAEEALAVGQGTARFYGLGAAGVFLMLQKGREAKLKEGDNIEVGFQRLPFTGNPPSH
jgi:hypothetical protein